MPFLQLFISGRFASFSEGQGDLVIREKKMQTTVLFRDLGFRAQGYGDLVSSLLMKYFGYYSPSILQFNLAGCWPSPNPSLRP